LLGLGVYDALSREMIDPESGEIYPALSCINDKVMAERCAVIGAEKVIWSVKAGAQFNSDCAFLLREGFRSGRIRLLETEYDGERSVAELRGYSTLTSEEKSELIMPYIHTTLLIDELTKLKHEESGNRVKIIERAGMRKDRYSSLSYNYYVALQIENKLIRKSNTQIGNQELFVVKAPKQNGKAVNNIGGRKKSVGWRG